MTFSARPANGQSVHVGDPLEEYLRILSVAGQAELGSFTVRPMRGVIQRSESSLDPWNVIDALSNTDTLSAGLRLSGVQASARTYLNTAFPWTENDGAVWQGRGLTIALEGGGTLEAGPLTVTLRPLAGFTQNVSFPLARPGASYPVDYQYPWSGSIDAPARLGQDGLAFVDPGQSSLRLVRGALSVGLGAENLWWGPGAKNSLLMTNNAGGFPHADLSTNGPVDLGFGTLEAQWIWGRLGDSEIWDATRGPRSRFITGAVVAFSPRAIGGLTLGVTRVFHRELPTTGLGLGEYFLVLQGVQKKNFSTPENPSGQDVHNQLASAFVRWTFPESGVEISGEYGRNDHGWDFRDYFMEPEHSRAYTLSFRKVSALPERGLLSFLAEVTHLGEPTNAFVRRALPWYLHGVSPHTHNGQILGAGVGPGGTEQFVGLDLYHPRGRTGFFLRRRVHDNDAYYRQAEYGDFWRHHVSLDLGAQALVLTRGIEVTAAGTLTRDINRYFVQNSDVWNLHLEMSGRWRKN